MKRRFLISAAVGGSIILSACGAPAIDSDVSARFQQTVRDIAASASTGDNARATELAQALNADVAAAREAGQVTDGKATEIQANIDRLLASLQGTTPTVTPEPEVTTPEVTPPAPAIVPTETLPEAPVVPTPEVEVDEDDEKDQGGGDEERKNEGKDNSESKGRETPEKPDNSGRGGSDEDD